MKKLTLAILLIAFSLSAFAQPPIHVRTNKLILKAGDGTSDLELRGGDLELTKFDINESGVSIAVFDNQTGKMQTMRVDSFALSIDSFYYDNDTLYLNTSNGQWKAHIPSGTGGNGEHYFTSSGNGGITPNGDSLITYYEDGITTTMGKASKVLSILIPAGIDTSQVAGYAIAIQDNTSDFISFTIYGNQTGLGLSEQQISHFIINPNTGEQMLFDMSPLTVDPDTFSNIDLVASSAKYASQIALSSLGCDTCLSKIIMTAGSGISGEGSIMDFSDEWLSFRHLSTGGYFQVPMKKGIAGQVLALTEDSIHLDWYTIPEGSGSSYFEEEGTSDSIRTKSSVVNLLTPNFYSVSTLATLFNGRFDVGGGNYLPAAGLVGSGYGVNLFMGMIDLSPFSGDSIVGQFGHTRNGTEFSGFQVYPSNDNVFLQSYGDISFTNSGATSMKVTDTDIQIGNNNYRLTLNNGSNGQALVTDGSGNVTWQTLSGTNMFSSDGSLTGNRTLTGSSNNLTFSGVNLFQINTEFLTRIQSPSGNSKLEVGTLGGDEGVAIYTGTGEKLRITIGSNFASTTQALGGDGTNSQWLEVANENIPSYADDTAAGVGGLVQGQFYQTDGTASSPLNVAGIVLIKQ